MTHAMLERNTLVNSSYTNLSQKHRVKPPLQIWLFGRIWLYIVIFPKQTMMLWLTSQFDALYWGYDLTMPSSLIVPIGVRNKHVHSKSQVNFSHPT